ncbi:MAG TPA: CpsB/CapC family capsule biosynthesis tyrosine phosphatase [Gemmatimonadaceae bacterium]|nr:CpsB/CapC family capsule biosynthesis tyrosine phosphatase [Gemmatimonadaceae bacterium]
MIDLHTHLLPGVDDGSRSIGDSVAVLARFAEAGVRTVACTPHLDASRAARAPFDRHAALLAELRAAAPAEIELLSGWEIKLDAPGTDLSDPRLRIGDSNAILVEFHRTIPPNAGTELARLRGLGLVPVVAHPERYLGGTVRDVAALRDAGGVMQLSTNALTRAFRMAEHVNALLGRGLIDLVASDTHVDERSLMSARAWLAGSAPESTLDLLTRENPRRLLAGEPLAPVPPIRLHAHAWNRLRQLVLGHT